MASLLGQWIEFLAQFIAKTLLDRFQALPPRAKKEPTQVYWVETISHNNFDYVNQQVREMFTQCLEANCKLHECMRVLKLREYWNKNDDNLVINNRFTKQGITDYWKSLDASFQFNIKKREEFMIRSKYRSLRTRQDSTNCSKKLAQVMMPAREDRCDVQDNNRFEVEDFFVKRHNKQDRFHWNNPRCVASPQFLLPRLKSTLSKKF